MGILRKFGVIMGALAVLPSAVLAQEGGTVTGRVTGQETGAPLSGVQIRVEGTTRRTVTGQNGEYRLVGVPAGRQTVDASVIGRQSANRIVAVVAGETVVANFALSSSALELEGLVVNAVTGRTERVREAGTNVETIDVAEINKGPISTVSDVLAGRTPGVVLGVGSGSVGSSQRIRIRGANSLSLDNDPLIFVDGIRFSNSKGGIGVGGQDRSRLNDLNPEDIESVRVLKGPAASALYGTAAANGVVLIQTKRGRAGEPVWRGYVEAGRTQDNTNFPGNFLAVDVKDPTAPVLGSNFRLNPNFGTACPNFRAAAGECQQEQLFSLNLLEDPRTTPYSTGENLTFGASVTGGSEAIQYFLSAEKSDEQGVIARNTLDRTSLRANLSAEVASNMRVQLSTGYIRSEGTLPGGDNNTFSPIINGVLGTAVFIPGADTLRIAGRRPGFGFGFAPGDLEVDEANQDIDRFLVGANATYTPLPWLSANVNTGLDFFSREDYQTYQPGDFVIYGPDFASGFRDSRRADNYVYTANGSLAGTFGLRPGLVSTTTVGGSYQRENFENTECRGYGIVLGTNSCAAATSLFEIDEEFSELRTLGAFAQQEFAFNDRLFLSVSARADDNSAFGSDFGTVVYPAASASWVVSEEPFFPAAASNFLSNLRLRAAYGTSGLQPNFRDAETLFAPTAVQIGGSDVSGVTLNVTGNPNLEPERVTEYELGLDAGLFDDRLAAEITYYNKRSEDALIQRDLFPSLGLTTTRFENLGEIRNSGIEAALNARVIERDNFRMEVRLAASALDNEIVNLGEGIDPIIFNRGNQAHIEGLPVGAFFGRKYTFNDADGNGLLSEDEVQLDPNAKLITYVTDAGRVDTLNASFLGSALPTNIQTFNADITLFKFLNVSTQFERRAGGYQLNDTESFRCAIAPAFGLPGGCDALYNPNATLEQQAAYIAEKEFGTTAGFIEEADFVKWRELSFRFGVPTFVSRTLPAFEGASFTIAGRNLKTWTDYSGIDPEITETGGSANFNQSEFNTQPPARVWTARFDFTF